MVPAQYTPVLKKLASKNDDMAPDKEDNVKAAISGLKSNMKDNKDSLGGLFDNAKETSVSKLFPGKGGEKVTSSPLLKVAFATSMRKAQINKTAAEVGVMFLGFQNELERIAR